MNKNKIMTIWYWTKLYKDVLAQLNALEIVSKLTSVEHGYKLIEADGTAKKLEHLVVNCSDQLSNILLLPG